MWHWVIRWCHIYREKSSHWCIYIQCKIFSILRCLNWPRYSRYFQYYSAHRWRIVRQRSISLSLGHGDNKWCHIYRDKLSHWCNANFSQICVSCIDDNWIDISIIPVRSGSEWYARGRSGIICDNVVLDDVTFIAINHHTDAYIYSMINFPNFALAILTTIEQIFLLFQYILMENCKPEVDQV